MPTKTIEITQLQARVEQHQEEQGLSDRALADLLGVSPPTPGNWKKGGEMKLQPHVVLQLSMMLQEPVNEIYRLHGLPVSDEVATPDMLSGPSGPSHWITTAVFAAEQLELLADNVLDLDAHGEVIDATDRFRQAPPPEPEDGAAAGQVAA